MRFTYKATLVSCFLGYIVQSISTNFPPLLFITFQKSYGIPLSQITLLVTITFFVQLFVDLFSSLFLDKIGYRICFVVGQLLSATGLILLAVLPSVLPPFTGLLLADLVYAMGSGVTEVLVSPITESCPTEHKEKTMSLLHSFYSWGHVGVVLISTVFFQLFGIENWPYLACFWAIIPLFNALLFSQVPLHPLVPEGEVSMPLRQLFTRRVFWALLLMMLCSGAAEQSVVQWTSAFAETGLGVSKTVGDLAGPMTFALLMCAARIFYGKYGDRINIDSFMTGSVILCIIAYLLICLSPSPVLSLLGCAVCGFSVGILWPGTLSKASAAIRTGGTAMFALLALSGDIGCMVGPTLVGFVSEAAGGRLKTGILSAIIFPILLLLCLLLSRKRAKTPA